MSYQFKQWLQLNEAKRKQRTFSFDQGPNGEIAEAVAKTIIQNGDDPIATVEIIDTELSPYFLAPYATKKPHTNQYTKLIISLIDQHIAEFEKRTSEPVNKITWYESVVKTVIDNLIRWRMYMKKQSGE